MDNSIEESVKRIVFVYAFTCRTEDRKEEELYKSVIVGPVLYYTNLFLEERGLEFAICQIHKEETPKVKKEENDQTVELGIRCNLT